MTGECIRTVVFRADASEGARRRSSWCAVWLSGHGICRKGVACGLRRSMLEALSVVPSLAETVADTLVVNGTVARFPTLVGTLAGWSAALLVVDHYGHDAAFERKCRPWAAAILAIDDLANRPHYADALVDQTCGREESDYLRVDGAELPASAGRPLRVAAATVPCRDGAALSPGAVVATPARRILISFGATDSARTTLLALQAIAEEVPHALRRCRRRAVRAQSGRDSAEWPPLWHPPCRCIVQLRTWRRS